MLSCDSVRWWERLSHACLSTEIPELITVVSNKFQPELQNMTSCRLLPSLLGDRDKPRSVTPTLNYWTRKLPWHNCFSHYVRFYQRFQNTRSAFPHDNKGLDLNPCSSRNPAAELQEAILALHAFWGVCAHERERMSTQFNSRCLVSILKYRETCPG